MITGARYVANEPQRKTLSRITEVARTKGARNAADLVRMTGIGVSTAHLIWEHPEYVPSQKVRDQIANALGVTPAELTQWVIVEGK
jgi:uncharacterized protein (DUF2342 family)